MVSSVCNKSVGYIRLFLFSSFTLKSSINESSARLYGRRRASLTQGVKQVLRRQTLHVGLPVCANGLRGTHVALATALDLVEDDTGDNDKEDAAESAAEGDQDDDSVGVAFLCTKG